MPSSELWELTFGTPRAHKSVILHARDGQNLSYAFVLPISTHQTFSFPSRTSLLVVALFFKLLCVWAFERRVRCVGVVFVVASCVMRKGFFALLAGTSGKHP